ncbi:class I SAM-dependent methyltransferase [Micromonospora sp. NPDC003241]
MTDTIVETYSADAPSYTVGAAASLFSSYVVTSAISASHQIGLLDLLHAEGGTDVATAAGNRLDHGVVRGLLDTLVWAKVVEADGDRYRTGPGFADVYAARGYFYWVVKGCGELFSIAPDVAAPEQRVGDFYHRDMRAVAIGSRLIGDSEVEPLFDEIVTGLDFAAIADLGCGSGQRLIRIAQRDPSVSAVGVDIARGSVELAEKSVADAGLEGRVHIVQGDVLNLEPTEVFADVEVVTCVFMGHDFWPMQRCVDGLANLRRAFPNVKRLMLCDVVRTPGPASPETTTIFTLGFELIHALMGVYIPSREEWLTAFEAAGWDLVRERHVAAPPSGILFELVPSAPRSA